MAELQFPDVVGSYLATYNNARQQKMADEDRTFQRQRIEQQDGRADILQKLQMMDGVVKTLGNATDDAGLARAKQQWVAMGLPEDAVAAYTAADIPMLREKAGVQFEALKGELLKEQINAQRANIRQSDASARAADALAGQRASGGGGGQPLPTRIQAAEDEDIEAIQTTQSINAQLDGVVSQLDNGTLELGPINNALSRGQNYLGASTPGSVAYSEMMSTLEKMRNDSLRLNKGVQTEGDAVRAWNELVANVNDPKVVKAQIARIKRLNEVASSFKKQLINVRRSRNGAPAFDFTQIGASPLAGQPPAQRPTAAPQGRGPAPGTIEDGFEFQGGDPKDPNNWEPVR